MLIPVRTISRWPAASARRTSREDRLGRERPLGAAGPRDDAVGAEERAAVLDLDERPGALDGRAIVGDAVDRSRRRAPTPDSVGSGPRASWPSRAEQRLELGEERGLAVVADQARVGVDRRERLGPDLDGAARDDDLGARVRPARPANGGARLLVGRRGDRARVHEDEVGGPIRVDERDAGLAQQARRRPPSPTG